MEHNYPFPAINDRWTNIFKQIDSVTATSHHSPSKFETKKELKKKLVVPQTTIAEDQEHVLRNN